VVVVVIVFFSSPLVVGIVTKEIVVCVLPSCWLVPLPHGGMIVIRILGVRCGVFSNSTV
jgi:hypothetical protein